VASLAAAKSVLDALASVRLLSESKVSERTTPPPFWCTGV